MNPRNQIINKCNNNKKGVQKQRPVAKYLYNNQYLWYFFSFKFTKNDG